MNTITIDFSSLDSRAWRDVLSLLTRCFVGEARHNPEDITISNPEDMTISNPEDITVVGKGFMMSKRGGY